MAEVKLALHLDPNPNILTALFIENMNGVGSGCHSLKINPMAMTIFQPGGQDIPMPVPRRKIYYQYEVVPFYQNPCFHENLYRE